MKGKNMKRIILQTFGATMAAILLVVVFVQFEVSGQIRAGKVRQTELIGGSDDGKIVGVWDARITLRNCQTGASIKNFRALLAYAAGETMEETNSGTAPSLTTHGHGAWKHLGGNRYSNKFKFFLFKADGSYNGWQKVSQQIDLSADGKQFKAVASVEIFDVDDKLAQKGCAAAAAVRFK